MHMGISSAPGWFEHFINGVLRDFLNLGTLGVYLVSPIKVYIDDIVLFSSSLEDHEVGALALIAQLKE